VALDAPPPCTAVMPSCSNSGPKSRSTFSWKPENISGVSMGTIMGACRGRLGNAPAATACANRSPGKATWVRAATLSGVRASAGRDWSRSSISSISSAGVMPQIASGEKTLSRRATAPTSLPSM
jgi:hypothetical protein